MPGLQPGGVAVQEIPTATIETLQGSDPSDVVAQLQAAARRRSVWTWVLAASLLASAPLALLPMLILGPLVFWLYQRDRAAQSVVAFYDLETAPAEHYDRLVAAAAVQQSHRNWALTGSGAVRTTAQYKVNSGAGSVVERKPAKVNMNGPRELVTNIAVPNFQCGDHQVFLPPDRVLVKHRRAFADLPYRELSVLMQPMRFHENGAVPRDSQQVGSTWQYVNKKNGGPDRRYKNNPRLRIMQYGRLTFTTRTGMNLQMQCSRPDAARQLAQAFMSYVAPAPDPSW